MNGDFMDELKRAISAIFLGEGLNIMNEEQILTAISLKRRWFSPEKARKMIENAKMAGLLEVNGKNLSPSFDYKEVEIPFGYVPPEYIAEVPEKSLEEEIISALKLSEEDAKKAISMDYNISNAVKLILWAALNGRPYKDMLDIVEKRIIGEVT